MRIELIENALSAKDFCMLKQSAGWGRATQAQADLALKNSLFTLVALEDNQVIAMGRLVGDGFLICYIQDVIVLPGFQGKGIGKLITRRLIEFAENNGLPDTRVKIGLSAAKDKEGFYEKLGFTARPDENKGPGMEMVVEVKTQTSQA